MTSVKLVLRTSVKVTGGTGSLAVRIIHNRKPKTITLPGCRLSPEEWDHESQRIIYPDNDPKRAAYLDRIEKNLCCEMEIINSLIAQLEKNGPYTVDDLASLYRRRKDDGKLSGFTESLAKELERNGQYRTADAYRTVVRGLVKFNKGIDIPLNHINNCFIKAFEKHLKDTGRMPNTIAYYIRNLRAIYNKAVSAKRVINRRGENPFEGISTAVTKTMKRALSLDEIQALYNLDLGNLKASVAPFSREYQTYSNLYRAWRYFFFCFYARGMCFIDLAYLRKDNIRGGIIRYCRKKTGQQIEVRLTGELKRIIESFASETTGSEYVFPIITGIRKDARGQYETAMRIQNDRLKKLAALAGIRRSISTHVARHSWATVGKQQNVSIQVLSECLGHTSPETTRIYLASLDNHVLDEANERITKAIKRRPALTRVSSAQ